MGCQSSFRMLPRQSQLVAEERGAAISRAVRLSKYHARRVAETVRCTHGAWSRFRRPWQAKLRPDPQPEHPVAFEHVPGYEYQSSWGHLLGDLLDLHASRGCDDRHTRVDCPIRASASKLARRQAQSLRVPLPSHRETFRVPRTILAWIVREPAHSTLWGDRRGAFPKCGASGWRRCQQWIGTGQLCNFDKLVLNVLP